MLDPYLTVPTTTGAALGAHRADRGVAGASGPTAARVLAPPLSRLMAARSPARERAHRRGGQRRRRRRLLQPLWVAQFLVLSVFGG
jgi:hypothetical protein